MNSDNELSVRIDDDGIHRLLWVEGRLELANTSPLRQAMVDLLPDPGGEAGRPAIIDLSGATAIDLSGMQLICSAHRTFVRRGASLAARQMPDGIRQTAHAAGFRMTTASCRSRCGEDCMWRD